MLRFTKGCKETNVAGPIFYAGQPPLRLRVPSQIQGIPSKRLPYRICTFRQLVYGEKIDFLAFSPFSKAADECSPNVASAGARARRGNRLHIVEATGPRSGNADFLFLTTNRQFAGGPTSHNLQGSEVGRMCAVPGWPWMNTIGCGHEQRTHER